MEYYVGTEVDGPLGKADPPPGNQLQIDPKLERFLCHPFFARYLQRGIDTSWPDLGLRVPIPSEASLESAEGAGTPVRVPDASLAHHACVFGGAGSGKSRFGFLLAREQMRAGRSLVAVDPKRSTVARLLRCAMEAHVPQDRVFVLDPSGEISGGAVPGWNPLAAGVPPEQAAETLSSIIQLASDRDWSPRMEEILVSALVVLSVCGLSFLEVVPFLTSKEYRRNLLESMPEAGLAATMARLYFQAEFDEMGGVAQSVTGVLSRLRPLLRNEFMVALLCAPRQTLDLASLWERQGVVLVHLDAAVLGDTVAEQLGGMVAHQLRLTAMRATGRAAGVPVVLYLDEMAEQARFIGGAVTRIANVAREPGLRLLVASQSVGHLPPDLRTALTTSTEVRAFFRPGADDVGAVAPYLARLSPEPERASPAPRSYQLLELFADDRTGTIITVDYLVSGTASPEARRTTFTSEEALRAVRAIGADPSNVHPLEVEEVFRRIPGPWSGRAAGVVATLDLRDGSVPGGSTVDLEWFLRHFPAGTARVVCAAGVDTLPFGLGVWREGWSTTPFIVVTDAPSNSHSRLSTVQEEERRPLPPAESWARALASLPNRHAVLCVHGEAPRVVRIADVDFPERGWEGETADMRCWADGCFAGAQSAGDAARVVPWRMGRVQEVAARPPKGAAPGAPAAGSSGLDALDTLDG